MLNICFSDTACCRLQEATDEDYLIASETVCIPDDLSLGDISNVKSFETRREILSALYQDDGYVDSHCQNNYRKFYQQLSSHDKIRIWYANTPFECCGMLYVLWLLQDSLTELEAICCSRTLKKSETQYVSYNQVADVRPEEFIRFLPFGELVSRELRTERSQEWEKLMNENGKLRVNWNQTVQTADVSYYDDVFLKYLGASATTDQLLERLVEQERLILSKSFLLSRLGALTEKGVLSLADGSYCRNELVLMTPGRSRNIINIEPELTLKKIKES